MQVFVSNLGNCSFNATTENTALDESREKAFSRYFKNCDIAGGRMRKVLASVITDLLLAGEVFIVLTKGGSIQLLPSERIGSTYNSDEEKIRRNRA